MSSRTARNSSLAGAAAVGVVAGILQVVAGSLSLSDIVSVPAPTWLKVVTGVELLGVVFVLAAFAAALVGFMLRARGSRTTVLAVSGGLFMGYGVATFVATLVDLVESWKFTQAWEFKASEVAGAAAGASLAVAALLAAIGVVASRPDGLLGAASLALAGDFALLCAVYSFELAGFHSFESAFFTPRAKLDWGLGTTAGGHLVAAAGAVVAAVAFFGANGRRRSGMPWQAQRERGLGFGASVIAVGFLVSTAGMMLLATESGSGRSSAEEWLRAVAQLLLAAAAACGAVAFFRSGRGAEQGDTGDALEDGDGPDLAAFADPG